MDREPAVPWGWNRENRVEGRGKAVGRLDGRPHLTEVATVTLHARSTKRHVHVQLLRLRRTLVIFVTSAAILPP